MATATEILMQLLGAGEGGGMNSAPSPIGGERAALQGGASQGTAYDVFTKLFDQQQQLAKAHLDTMKQLPEKDRMDYLRTMMLTSGQATAEQFDAAPEDLAAQFMHSVNSGLGAKARDYGLAASDAALFFGIEQPKDRN